MRQVFRSRTPLSIRVWQTPRVPYGYPTMEAVRPVNRPIPATGDRPVGVKILRAQFGTIAALLTAPGGRMKHHTFSALLLTAAVILEAGGFAGSTAMLAGGFGCEMLFWSRLVTRRRASSSMSD